MLLADVVIVSRLLGCVECSLVLGADKVLAMLLMSLPLVLLGAFEHLETLAAVEEAVPLDQVRTVMANQVVMGKVKVRGEFELASQTALFSVGFQLVAGHPA